MQGGEACRCLRGFRLASRHSSPWRVLVLARSSRPRRLRNQPCEPRAPPISSGSLGRLPGAERRTLAKRRAARPWAFQPESPSSGSIRKAGRWRSPRRRPTPALRQALHPWPRFSAQSSESPLRSHYFFGAHAAFSSPGPCGRPRHGAQSTRSSALHSQPPSSRSGCDAARPAHPRIRLPRTDRRRRCRMTGREGNSRRQGLAAQLLP